MKVASLFWTLLCGMAVTSSTFAALITAAPSGTTVAFPGGAENCPAGPTSATVAGFSIETSGDACYNTDVSFAFGQNGFWEGLGLIGDNVGGTLITIDLGDTFSAVGGFMNYSREDADAPVIAALAADASVLETYDISDHAPINTQGAMNEGAFRGIARDTADIRFFVFGGSFSAFHNLTLIGAASVPEPGVLALLGVALAGLGFGRRKLSARAR